MLSFCLGRSYLFILNCWSVDKRARSGSKLEIAMKHTFHGTENLHQSYIYTMPAHCVVCVVLFQRQKTLFPLSLLAKTSFSFSCLSTAWVNFNGIHYPSDKIVDNSNFKNNSDIDSKGNCAYQIVNTSNNGWTAYVTNCFVYKQRLALPRKRANVVSRREFLEIFTYYTNFSLVNFMSSNFSGRFSSFCLGSYILLWFCNFTMQLA